MKSSGRPYAETRLAKYLQTRMLQLRPHKSQLEIANEAGFKNANVLSMIKSGSTKLALDRVPALAVALEADPRRLFLLALEQEGNETIRAAVEQIFKTIVTENETNWLLELRDASGHSDPRLTSRTRSALRAIFGK